MMTLRRTDRALRGGRISIAGYLLCAALVIPLLPSGAAAQATSQGTAQAGVIEVTSGNSHLILHPVVLQRVSIADPAVADAVVVSAREIVINGKKAGTTSLILWDNAGGRDLYSVRVTADAGSLEEDLRELFPEDDISVEASGASVILSGSVGQALTAEKAVDIALKSLGEGASVIDNLSVPDPGQILLQVRFAEVSRTALERAGINILRFNADKVSGFSTAGRPSAFSGEFPRDLEGPQQTFSDAVNLFLFEPDADLSIFIQALKSNGLFRSLAEPNLLAVHGQKATFLAGGEFPYPVVQGGAAAGAVTIQFREFGVRLDFTPTITTSGNIRLHVAPEVSSLDFANGLTLSGFNIPAILSRKAETEIELRDGQTFAIAGLIDNSIIKDVDKIPVLGDIPILGALFRSTEMRQNRSELLVLVTPRLVQPLDEPPAVPPGEPDGWDWDKRMREPLSGGSGSPSP
jgi:pilus assembly protein CpaC